MSRARDISDGKFANDLTVDTNTLVVDAANNRVGIGTTAPDSNLKIKSTGAATLRLDGGAVASSVGPLIVGEHNDTDAFYIGTNSVVLGESSNQDVVIYGADSSSGNIRFYAGASTETARIRDGGGITFNGDTAAANALDDYEEGTWTPALDNTVGNGPTVTYDTQIGRYTKVGNRVHWTATIRWSAFTVNGSGFVKLVGFPFNAVTLSGFSQGANFFGYANGIGGSNSLQGLYIDGNTNFFFLTTSANPTSELSVSSVSGSGIFFCGGSVIV